MPKIHLTLCPAEEDEEEEEEQAGPEAEEQEELEGEEEEPKAPAEEVEEVVRTINVPKIHLTLCAAEEEEQDSVETVVSVFS